MLALKAVPVAATAVSCKAMHLKECKPQDSTSHSPDSAQAGSAALVGSLRRIMSQQSLTLKAVPVAAAAVSLKGRARAHKASAKADKPLKPGKPKRDELPP